MGKLKDNKLYEEDIEYVAKLRLPWSKLKNSSIIISGATGMLGSFLIDVLSYKNINDGLNCHIYALGRNRDKAKKRFSDIYSADFFSFIECDINDNSFTDKLPEKAGYVFHAASNTHPMAYATDPIGTITANIFATNNFLKYCSEKKVKRFVLASSNEIYGENRKDTELFDENYCGYINCNTLRAGYPESKRSSEALCQAYIAQKDVDAVIVRFTRSFGPTLLATDTKAMTQFLKNGINKEDIVLKSEGNQYYSYTYMADAIAGMLTVMLKGQKGEAYNIADESGDITLKDLAKYIANYSGTNVRFEIPDDVEKAGYSTATKARLDGSKVKTLGWKANYEIGDAIERTIDIIKDTQPSYS